MSRLRYIAEAAMAGSIALLVMTASSAAQGVGPEATWTPKPPALAKTVVAKPAKRAATAQAKKPAKPSAAAQAKKSSALALAAETSLQKAEHHLILQVNTNDPAAMNLALNNAMNVTQYYKQMGENVKIEVVTFGPGLHMLRDDTSPV